MTLPKHYTCIGCGLTRKDVEAGGIYWCPNPACTACGAYNHRLELKSFKEEDGYHSIDPLEMVRYINEIDEHLEEEISIVAEKCVSLFWGEQI